ncbi:hypothetical protein GCM10009745_63290 [Kribbella yunnanensis]|uniref:Cupin type-1 domain-containing protein n=1 Tax=Kribbella yunnanensis TaxID=190194 RepID=A0ABP4UP28_9ACTN
MSADTSPSATSRPRPVRHTVPSPADGVVARSGGIEVRVVKASPGVVSPWGECSVATTTLVGLSGSTRIDTVDPNFSFALSPGDLYSIPPGLIHRVTADECSQFLRFGTGPLGERRLVDLPGDAAPPLAANDDSSRDEDPSDLTGALVPGVSRVDTLAKAEGLRVIVQELGPTQCVPWHLHDRVTDVFVCLAGPMVVRTCDDSGAETETVLRPGDMHAVTPGVPHFVAGANGRRTRSLIIQGPGAYNYVSV